MSRMIGTVSMGVRAPIIHSGDDMVEIVSNAILDAIKEDGLVPRDKDVVAVTESVVARAQNNYASVEDIAADVKAKLEGEEAPKKKAAPRKKAAPKAEKPAVEEAEAKTE